MEESLITTGQSYVCLECKNENALDSTNIGDVVECDFCGIEYEIIEEKGKNYKLVIIEEEK